MLEESYLPLFIELCFGETVLATGTAFLAGFDDDPNSVVLVTNRHNATGRHQETGRCLSPNAGIPDHLKVYFHGESDKTWVEASVALTDEGRPLWVEHPTLGPKADFVALRPPRFPLGTRARAQPIALGLQQKIKLEPTEGVSVLGFPFGMRVGGYFPIFTTGSIATEMELDVDDMPMFLIDCNTAQGHSGSPVIAMRSGMFRSNDGSVAVTPGRIGEVLGIYSGRVREDSYIGRVWKISAVEELVRHAKTLWSRPKPSFPSFGFHRP